MYSNIAGTGCAITKRPREYPKYFTTRLNISDVMDSSASRYRVKSVRKGKWIKYAHFLFKDNPELWAFTMKGLELSVAKLMHWLYSA